MRTPFRKLDPRITVQLGKHKREIILGLIASALSACITALTALFIKWVVDEIIANNPGQLAVAALATVGLFSLKYWFTRDQTYYLGKAAAKLTADLRAQLYAKLQRLPLSYFSEKRSGAVQSVLTNDVLVFQGAISSVKESIDGPIKIVSGFAIVFFLQWQLALAVLLLFPPMAIFIQKNGRKMRRTSLEVQDDLGTLNALTQETLQGVRIIKAFSAEERVRARFGELLNRTYESQLRSVSVIATLKPMVELLGAAALALVLYLSGLMIQRDPASISVASIASLIYTLDVINQGVRAVASMNSTYAQVQAATDRIHREVFDVPDSHEDQSGSRRIDQPIGRIEFQNVSFTYPDGTQALRNVSFTIEPGTSLALVGPSGAGKSTIADLLLRFYVPTSGRITYDGVDIHELELAWWRGQIGVVPQQTFLFAGTITENILLGAPNASESDVRGAADAANAVGFIERTSDGFETILGERGARLSGGEMQRIAIARAVVRKPRVLLLDEATSNLDAESEKAVQNALEEVMQDRTTLFIAHRLSTAARADRILVLTRGEIVEIGSHASLIEADGIYAGMYRAFSSGVIDGVIA